MTFYEKLEKYLERGLHVMVGHDTEGFALISPGGRDSMWQETEEDAIACYGSDFSESYWRSKLNLEIIRTYTPEELNPKFKRYEVGDKVVYWEGWWFVTKAHVNLTYNIDYNEEGGSPNEEENINHYDLKPYIEEEDVKESEAKVDISEVKAALIGLCSDYLDVGGDPDCVVISRSDYMNESEADYKRGREDMRKEILEKIKDEDILAGEGF